MNATSILVATFAVAVSMYVFRYYFLGPYLEWRDRRSTPVWKARR